MIRDIPEAHCTDCGARITPNADRCPTHQRAHDLAVKERHNATRPQGKSGTVYSHGAVRHLRITFGACRCCTEERELVNGYCAVCRAVCANERECESVSYRD